uniref:Uncharacterized protein n=1 Tax=Lepeophtheirus salmonis TaxID=72036 RepID=A0A0K2VEP9_LEPSM
MKTGPRMEKKNPSGLIDCSLFSFLRPLQH